MRATAEFPYVFPPLWFYWKALNADLFFIADSLKIPKRPRVNRYTVCGAGGSHRLTVPLHRPGGWFSKLSEVEIVSAQRFAEEHLRVLRNEMANAPYLDLYLDEVEALLRSAESSYVAFALRTIKWLADKLGVRHVKWERLTAICDEEVGDRCLLKACKAYRAETYVLLRGQKDVRDPRAFEGEGIRIESVVLPDFRYRNLCGSGSWEISALDFLLNYGPEASLRLHSLLESSR